MFQATGEGADFVAAVVGVNADSRSGLMTETQAGAVFVSGSNGACGKAATAVGTYVVEYSLDTVRTEGAFIGTDARCGRIRWQIAITEFTVGAKF